MSLARLFRDQLGSKRRLGSSGVALAVWTVAVVVFFGPAALGYDAMSDGSDGAFTVPGGQMSIEIDLSKAENGHWLNTAGGDTDGDGRGDGVYDADQWAVVFKYTTITVPAGVTVTFKNHPKGAPVVWLAQGNVTINGTVRLNGTIGGSPNPATPIYANGGPGGFAGGIRAGSGSPGASAGHGPGGGGSAGGCCAGGGGGFGEPGANGGGSSIGGIAYGSPTLVPLIGGSGGGGDRGSGGGGGGGGGGGILIASSGIISIAQSGIIEADGGPGNVGGGAGSGGGIRLIADEIGGTGVLRARSGSPTSLFGKGRIRVETLPGGNLLSVPSDPMWSPSTSPGPLFPAIDAPRVRITNIGNAAPSTDPFGNFVWGEDILISKVSTAAIISIEANNVQPGSTVQVRLVRASGDATTVTSTSLIGNFDLSTATASVIIPAGRSILQLRLTLP